MSHFIQKYSQIYFLPNFTNLFFYFNFDSKSKIRDNLIFILRKEFGEIPDRFKYCKFFARCMRSNVNTWFHSSRWISIKFDGTEIGSRISNRNVNVLLLWTVERVRYSCEFAWNVLTTIVTIALKYRNDRNWCLYNWCFGVWCVLLFDIHCACDG